MKVDLSSYDNDWYFPGSKFKIAIWYIVSRCFFRTSLPFPSFFKVIILRLFGSKIGASVVIKPNVVIKYPWFLEVGKQVWIGEDVWIDNLCSVKIESNVIISQGAYLLTGNHDFTKSTFDLRLGAICLKQGSWVGAKSIVCPSTILFENAVLCAGSIATSDLLTNGIYQGNPAVLKKYRIIT
ncbi:WcaF family extracellular polysaccharide biosynthesis acetyltransferase [Pseudoalteromonas xiamenensis]